MYSICACSSYGRICASYFCIVGSKGTRLMAETLPLRETHDFVWTSISCLWIFWLKQTAMVQRWWRKKNCKMTGAQPNTCDGDRLLLPRHLPIQADDFFYWCTQRTRRDRKLCSGHCFSFSFLSASLLCLPVYICVKHDVCD